MAGRGTTSRKLKPRVKRRLHAASRGLGQPAPDAEEDDNISCRNCGHPVTSVSLMISVKGSHQHTFTNPAGIVFTIRCFAHAGGCTVTGRPSSEHTWFPGYGWSVCVCSNCLRHLGWHFQSGDASFFGLVRDNIIERIRTH